MKKLVVIVLAVILALSAVTAFAAEYTDKDTVKKVQQALNDAGFDCGTPDGAAGKKTKNASIMGWERLKTGRSEAPTNGVQEAGGSNPLTQTNQKKL